MTAIQSHVQSVVFTLEKAPAIILTAREALRLFGPLSVYQINEKLAMRGHRVSLDALSAALEAEDKLPWYQRCIRLADVPGNAEAFPSARVYKA